MGLLDIKKKYTFTAQARAVPVNASSKTEDTQTIQDAYTKNDRLPVVELKRTSAEETMESCEWAYENDHATHNSVCLYDNVFNNGIEAFIDSDKDIDLTKPIYNKAADWLDIESSPSHDDIPSHISSLAKNNRIHGLGVSVIQQLGQGKINMIDLDTKECRLIKNLRTGNLGDGIGYGLDAKNPNKDVAIVQHGNTIRYDTYGNKTYVNKDYFYFDMKELLLLPNKDIGRIKGQSPVAIILRLVEIKQLLQNILALEIKRFGPQVYVQLGNENTNFTNVEIPDKYINALDSDGNKVSYSSALSSYKSELFDDIQESLTDWVNGDNIMQLVEYGVEIKTLNPSAGMIDLARYINMMTNYIKIGILELDVSGRIDVTSGVMREITAKDLKDTVRWGREYIMDMLNEKYVKYKLESKFPTAAGIVKLRFKPLDRVHDAENVNIELDKSKTIYNYAKAGMTIPEYLKKDWNMQEIKPIIEPGSEEPIDKENPNKDETNKNGSLNSVKKMMKEKAKTNPAMKKTVEDMHQNR